MTNPLHDGELPLRAEHAACAHAPGRPNGQQGTACSALPASRATRIYRANAELLLNSGRSGRPPPSAPTACSLDAHRSRRPRRLSSDSARDRQRHAQPQLDPKPSSSPSTREQPSDARTAGQPHVKRRQPAGGDELGDGSGPRGPGPDLQSRSRRACTVTIDSTNGTIVWTPTEAQGPGTYAVTVRVTTMARRR